MIEVLATTDKFEEAARRGLIVLLSPSAEVCHIVREVPTNSWAQLGRRVAAAPCSAPAVRHECGHVEHIVTHAATLDYHADRLRHPQLFPHGNHRICRTCWRKVLADDLRDASLAMLLDLPSVEDLLK